jgi:hypothetical protein
MKKYEKIFQLLDEGKKQAEIVKNTGFTIDTVKKVSQLRKIYSKIQSNINSTEILDKVRSLKFKALELKKIVDYRELLEECLAVVDENTKQSEIKEVVTKLITRSDRLRQAKENYVVRKESIEHEIKAVQEIIIELENKENLLTEKYTFLKNKNKKTKSYIESLVGIYNDEFALKGRLSLDIKDKEKFVKYNRNQKVWIIKDIDKFVKLIENRVNNKESIVWSESEHFKTKKCYYNGYNYISKEDQFYKLPGKIDDFGIQILERKLKNSQKRMKELKKELKTIRSENAVNYKEDTLFADSVIDSDIAEHRLVQDTFLKYFFKENYAAASEIAIGNKRFDTVLFKPSKIVIGEVKASRSDFISDNKYLTYLEHCNELYMVLSSNIRIKQIEIDRLKDEGVGLYIVDTKNNTVEKVHDSLTRNIDEIKENKIIDKLLKVLGEKTQNKC